MSTSQVRRVEGTALPLRGDEIDTDRIMPARFLRVVTFAGLEQHVFEDDRAQLRAAGRRHAFDEPAYEGATILLAGSNFGCGSSREHAPQGLQRAGFEAIVAESFSEIFFGNSLALGMPCLTASREAVGLLMDLVEKQPASRLVIDLAALKLSHDGGEVHLGLPPAAQEAFVAGAWDATGMLTADPDQIRAIAASLPYISGFASK
jgi:3-isopropylmalate/(R)-2-methylmalate dehydratase small subunit